MSGPGGPPGREPITDPVLEQLAAVLESGRVDRPVNWMAVQGVAHEAGHEDLVEFIVAADAATYYEALRTAADRADAAVPVPDPRPRREPE